MDNKKKKFNTNRVAAYALSGVMLASVIPYNVFATKEKAEEAVNNNFEISAEPTPVAQQGIENKLPKNRSQDTNWSEALIDDERNWPVDLDGGQKIVRVTTSDPTQITDLNYDSTYVDAEGRTNIRLVYREKTQLTTAVWKRLLLRFDKDLYDKVDWDKSHAISVKDKKFALNNSNGKNEKALEISELQGAKGNDRYNLPINLVLKEGVSIKDLGERNYLVQARLTDKKSERIYAYAPKGTRLDYSTYTKAATIPLANEMDMAFLKGGPEQSKTYALQNSFFSEFIANPEEYPDSSNLGIIRTQYMAQRAVLDPKDVQSGKPSGYVMMFDAGLVKYLKADKNGNIAYTNILKKDRVPNPLQQIGIKEENINYLKDENGENEIAYFVLATQKFQKDGVKVVRIGTDNYDRLVNLGGMYITALDMVVDKKEFEKTIESTGKNKVDFPIMTGWADSNPKGWTIYEQDFDHDFVVPAGQDFFIDTGVEPEGGTALFQLGDPEDSIIRRPQGYYNGTAAGLGGLDQFKEIGNKNGLYSLTLREGTTIKAGDKLRIFLPDTVNHKGDVNFIAFKNGTELNQGGATLTLQADRNINMHLFAPNRNEFFKLKYTLKGEKEQRELKMTRLGTWDYDDKDQILDGWPNKSITRTGGNFWINMKKVEPGSDIFVEAYDADGNLKEGMTSSLIYNPIPKSEERYTRPSWLDSTDNLSLISLKKSVYKPYQEIYTNDYAMSEEGLENADKINQIYRDPRSIPASSEDFMKDIEKVQGFTRYDGGRIRMLYVAKDGSQHITKTHAAENEYNDDGDLVGDDVRKNITVEKTKYQAFPYELYLKAFSGVRQTPETGVNFKLYKDMRLMSTASDGSSIPSDWLETRVKTRVLFDATDGTFAENKKQEVKIVPDNVKFYDEDGYKANGFTGEGVQAGTGDEFVKNPTAEGKTFLGWVTEAGKTALGNKTVTTAAEFEKLTANTEKFTAQTPVERHLVVYAVWSEEKLVTFDANGGQFEDKDTTKEVKIEDGKVVEPKAPTREGYTFKGWASKSDATEPEDGILANIEEAKTVYAVWEEEKGETDAEKNPAVEPDKTEVEDKTALTPEEKAEVEQKVKDKNPEAKEVEVGDDGSVTITYPDDSTNTLTPDQTVTEKAKTDAEKNPAVDPTKTEVANKDKLTDDEKAKVVEEVKKANPEAKDVTVDDKGNATLTYEDGTTNEIPGEKTVTEKTTSTPEDKKSSVDETGKKSVDPTDEKQETGVKIENKDDDTKVTAKDEDGKDVPVEIDKDGNVIVTPGENVDGPITVVIEDKDLPGGKVEVEVPVNGHEKGRDDNNNGKPSDNDNTGGNHGYRPGHGGRDVFDRLFRRHDYTPTYPVKTVVPEKTEYGTPVRDTLWYVFHINEFQYEVVRNGVVTKRLMDVTPVIQNGRTMLPLRYVAEALQADVTWDAKTRTATFTKDGLTASIQIDSDEIVLSNGKTVKMDSKPLNINDRILVSVTNVANVFGLTNGNTKDNADQDIEWEQEDKSATIYIRR